MTRNIDTDTLDAAGQDYALWFMADRAPWNRAFVVKQFKNFQYLDEFQHMIDAVRKNLGATPKRAFDTEINRLLSDAPRAESVFHDLLAQDLAIDPDGEHIDGRVGAVQIDRRFIGLQPARVELPWSIQRREALGLNKTHRVTHQKLIRAYWPIYAGEGEERAAESDAVDPLPEGTPGLAVGAFNTRISNEVAILMCDAAVDNLDEGTQGGILTGRSGVQPADPDTAPSGTLLFTLPLSDPAFGAAVDAAPGAIATANAITDDSSADATGTLGYCRGSSSNDNATALDDHIDGEAGTSGADFNFNTVSIVAGAAVSMTSWTITQPES